LVAAWQVDAPGLPDRALRAGDALGAGSEEFLAHTRDGFIEAYTRAMTARGVREGEPAITEVVIGAKRRFEEFAEPYGPRGDGKPRNPPVFIHLKNARIVGPGESGEVGGEGFWWLGKLEAVDAWTLGELADG
jgi:hypothetical protein